MSGQTRDRALELLDALATRYAFRDVAALVAGGACDHCRTPAQVTRIQQLCTFGQRLLDLDAEDFGESDSPTDAKADRSFAGVAGGDGVPADLVARSLAARMPQSPHEPDRGGLATLHPSFALLLEVISVRWMRHEMSSVVAALHIASEYGPMLSWEPVLGHAGDPVRMPASVGGDGSRWGAIDDHDCPHSNSEKAAAARALRAATEPDPGWRAYLDRQHSLVSAALGVCAATCRTRCTVITRRSPSDQDRLADACRIARSFTDSTLIQLRHSAPVGHGFGVPSPREVLAAWAHTRAVLAPRAPAVLTEDGFVLPGLPSLFSTLAGTPIVPDTLIGAAMTALRAALT